MRSTKILKDNVFQTVGINSLVDHKISFTALRRTFFFKFFVCNLYTQGRAGARDPEIKSCALMGLREPGTPRPPYFKSGIEKKVRPSPVTSLNTVPWGHRGGSVSEASAFRSGNDLRVLGSSSAWSSLLSGQSASPSACCPPPPHLLVFSHFLSLSNK